MKQFISTFAATLIFVEVFLFFGGYMIFDFSQRWYVTGAACALLIALVIHAFVCQDEKIEELEKRVQELEKAEL